MRLTVATTFATYPPKSGAALRNFHLYRHIARHHEIELLALVKQDEGSLDSTVAPGLREVRVPISDAHLHEELRVCERADGVPVGDFAVWRLYPLTPNYLQALRESCSRADLLIASHPHLIYALREVSGKPIIYEAPDVEYDLRRATLPNTVKCSQLLSQIAITESHCIAEADLILACSAEDRARFVDIYGTEPEKIKIAPNGADIEGIPFLSWDERRKRHQGADKLTCLFLASWANFNVAAASCVMGLARLSPRVRFVIAGSVGLAFRGCQVPENVIVTGVIEETEKLDWLSRADVALNPVLTGSGSSIKMVEYALAGLPIITTRFGARGVSSDDAILAIVCEINDFTNAINEIATAPDRLPIDNITRAARSRFEDYQSWAKIGDDAAAWLESLHHSRMPTNIAPPDKVSVLIPMLDAEPYIEECLASVLDQSHANLEVLVVDDGSKDRSALAVRSFAARDQRVHLLHHPHNENRGVSRSIELALHHSRGEYIALLDADDQFEPEKIALQLQAMRAHPEVVLCHTRASVLADEETELSRSCQAHFDVAPSAPIYWLLHEPSELGMCYILSSSALIKSSSIRKIRFAGRQVYQSEDWLIMAMLASEGPYLFIPDRLVKYRVHSKSYTSRVLTSPLHDLYSRLEMLIKLLSQSQSPEINSMIEHHLAGVLWSLETEYAEDAPIRPGPAPVRLREELATARAESNVLKGQLNDTLQSLNEIVQSRSWRMTSPLRAAISAVRRIL